MKILLVTEYYFPHIGGLERLFQNLSEGLVRAGHSVDVVTCSLPGSEKEETIKGVDIHRVSVPPSGDRYWFTVGGVFKSAKYAKETDVILTTTYNGAFPAWFAAKLSGKPVAIFTHEVVGKNWSRIGLTPAMASLYRLLETLTLSLPFDAFITNSDSTLSALKEWGAPKNKLTRIYPGIDYSIFNPERYVEMSREVRRELGLTDDEFCYIFFGRPGYVKGVEFLVRAVPLIKELVPNSKCLLILSRKPTEGFRNIERLVEELELEEDVIIKEPVPEVELPAYLAASDCVVVPSLSEGFGFTCVEACSMDRPVVVSNTASLPEVVYGRFVLAEPGSSESIARGVEKIYRREYMVTERKEFRWDDTVSSHLAVFSELIELKRGQAVSD